MAALLDWASDDDHVLAPASRPKRPILWLGGTSPSVEAAIWRGDQLGSPVTRVSQAGAPWKRQCPARWPARSLTELLLGVQRQALQALRRACHWLRTIAARSWPLQPGRRCTDLLRVQSSSARSSGRTP